MGQEAEEKLKTISAEVARVDSEAKQAMQQAGGAANGGGVSMRCDTNLMGDSY